MAQYATEGDIQRADTLESFVEQLPTPRVVLVMVKAGGPVDAVLNGLKPLLEKGDIVVDGGNSHYKDTRRRFDDYQTAGLHFIGMGVSGGEEGALNGPSMMPGGPQETWKTIAPIFEPMSAPDGLGGRCVSLCGPSASGHFVKMVHNGIEYAIMMFIAEIYDTLKTTYRLPQERIVAIFSAMRDDPILQSFLLDITKGILVKKDDDGELLLNKIVDESEQKGTGRWTVETALELGIAVPSIAAAVAARSLSGNSALRAKGKGIATAKRLIQAPENITEIVKQAYLSATVLAYIQGFELLMGAGAVYGFDINIKEVSRIWRGGCIIQSALLAPISTSFATTGDWTAGELTSHLTDNIQGLRQVVADAVLSGTPFATFTSAIGYYDQIVAPRLPQDMIQGMRDCFGAHTFKRTDKDGVFHVNWSN